MKKGLLILGAILSLSSATNIHAELVDIGRGLINDTAQGITWLRDANFVKTSCDANNLLWQAFDPGTAKSNARNKKQICEQNGRLNWHESEAWIAVLNAHNFLGYNDWRQPATQHPDSTCSSAYGNGLSYGFRCAGSELGHLINISLKNPNHQDNECFKKPPHCLHNSGIFINVQSYAYWSDKVSAPFNTSSWSYNTGTGYQDMSNHYVFFFVWPVRTGL